jgi:CheY-like chemotaxis protein
VRLRQIIGNLISNAVKFTSEGMVTISADIEHSAPRRAVLRMAVEDTGVGMSEETKARLFRPFVQADDSTARRFGGTGLGLSICLKLVKLMEGTIMLDSILGAGSRVTVELPMTPAAESVQESAADLAGVNVLVVAPDQAESGYFKSILDYWNAKTVVTTLDRMAAALPDCQIVLGPLMWEEKIRAAMAASGLHDALRRLVFYSFEDLAQDRQSGMRDALYTTALSRARVVTAVAVAAGRKSPEVEMVQSVADRELGISPVSRDAALARGQLILLAEDHPVNRDVILRQLRLLGYAADAFENGVAALAALQATPYALVLTDCNMPEMDGFALTKAIRESGQALRTLPVIALTANAMAGESQRCLSAGMDAYLSKPVSLSDLRACLGRWMPHDRPEESSADTAAGALSQAASGTMDLSLLRECFGDDETGLKENLSTFLSALQDDMRVLADAIQQSDEASVKHVAHRVKGAAKFVGGAQLIFASEALEASAAGKNWPDIHRHWPALVDAGNTITLEIQSLCAAG